MRFSAVFDPPGLPLRPQVHAAAPAPGEPSAPPAAATPGATPGAAALPQLPDDLDQRVRQIGEWQLDDW